MVARIAARTAGQIVQTLATELGKGATKVGVQTAQQLATRTSSGFCAARAALPGVANSVKSAAQQGGTLAGKLAQDAAKGAIQDLATSVVGVDNINTGKATAGAVIYNAAKSTVLAHMQHNGALDVFKTAAPKTSSDNG